MGLRAGTTGICSSGEQISRPHAHAPCLPSPINTALLLVNEEHMTESWGWSLGWAVRLSC